MIPATSLFESTQEGQILNPPGDVTVGYALASEQANSDHTVGPLFPFIFVFLDPHMTTTTTRADEPLIVVCSAHSDTLISISLQQQAVPKPGSYCYHPSCRLRSTSHLHVLILGT